MDVAIIEKDHWLKPFVEKIIEFYVTPKFYELRMHLHMSEFKISFTSETVMNLGIEDFEIETPVRETGRAWPFPSYEHTGEIMVFLRVRRNTTPPQAVKPRSS